MSDQGAFNQTLQDRITSLKKKQRELELIAKVVDFANKLPEGEEPEFKDVAEKVANLFFSFSNRAMDNLSAERSAAPAPAKKPATVIAEEQVSYSEQQLAPVPKKPIDSPIAEKLKFLQAWKHLERAKVKVGDKVGVVRGLDAPNVVIMAEDGSGVFKSVPEALEVLTKGR